MNKLIPLLVISILLLSCSRTSNLIKLNSSENNKSVFSKESIIYFVKLESNNVAFYQGGGNNFNSIADVELNDYKISKEKDSVVYKEMCDEFGLVDNNNYGFSSSEAYFANEYNDIFNRVMGGESLRMSAFVPKKFTIKTLDSKDVAGMNFHVKKISSPIDGLQVEVFEPTDSLTFYKDFREKYSDADFLVLVSNIYITNNILEMVKNYTHYNLYTGGTTSLSSSVEDFILVPKTIIDIKNFRISGFHIGRNAFDPGIFDSDRTGIQTAMYYDVLELNQKY
ncbi:MAG TPA: hypothetical protein VLH59_02500 [Ignavibacteriaceae bacterium]|nr:hypothetical protein [Ignavibacteriaceae bacterium]